ncbi:cytidine deaminase [Candidatus Parcubacteria bacterium]|nr:MAG: cytidine deaminase [Candidatus Parcubacteria bacterium]
MTKYNNLVEEAKKLAKAKKHNDCMTSAYVGSALITDKGNVYTGISIDADCAIGFCAEHSAISEMIKNKETKIEAIVAVSHQGKILAPCGRCRELIYQTNYNNKNTKVIMGPQKTSTLAKLLPYNWQNK